MPSTSCFGELYTTRCRHRDEPDEHQIRYSRSCSTTLVNILFMRSRSLMFCMKLLLCYILAASLRVQVRYPNTGTRNKDSYDVWVHYVYVVIFSVNPYRRMFSLTVQTMHTVECRIDGRRLTSYSSGYEEIIHEDGPNNRIRDEQIRVICRETVDDRADNIDYRAHSLVSKRLARYLASSR